MSEKAYCPICKHELELLAACGAANYFCKHCKKLVASKSVLHSENISEVEEEKE